MDARSNYLSAIDALVQAQRQAMTPEHRTVRSGFTKNYNQGQSKTRKRMTKASRRRNRRK